MSLFCVYYSDGSIGVMRRNDEDQSGEAYDINGDLYAINPSGIDDTDPTKDEEQFWIYTSSMTLNQEDGSYTDKNGNIYIKNPDGTYSLDKSIHSNYNESTDSQDIKVGGDTISLKHNGDYTGDTENNNYSGYTTEEPSRYAVVTTDENGTKVEYYDSKEAYENNEAQSSSTEYKNDGSKVETTIQEVDGKTTTTSTTTDKNGNISQEASEIKDENGNVIETKQTNIASDGQKTTVSTKTENGETQTTVQINDGEVITVPLEQIQGDKYLYVNYNPQTGEIEYTTADRDSNTGEFTSINSKVYGADGSLKSVNANGVTYNLDNYEYNEENKTYTKIVTTDGSIQQQINFDENGNMTVTSIENGKESNDSFTYDSYGNPSSATIGGVTYTFNADGKAVGPDGQAGNIAMDEYGRYKFTPLEE